MFESLSERLESAFKLIRGESRVTDLNVANTVKEIRRALIDADVNYKIAKEFTDKVKEKAMGMPGARNTSPCTSFQPVSSRSSAFSSSVATRL